ncbi:MAG TPA: hypothetical protein VF239_15745 [Vicinamibacterales bacterium]|jgi:hypothetical protein
MTEQVERMFAEVLAQRLGLDGGETPEADDSNQLKTALVLSLMQQMQSRPPDNASVIIRRVAAILGACPRCLGDNPACSHCEGQGRPGTRTPDRTALLQWLDVPLQRLGLRISARKTSTTRTQPMGG